MTEKTSRQKKTDEARRDINLFWASTAGMYTVGALILVGVAGVVLALVSGN